MEEVVSGISYLVSGILQDLGVADVDVEITIPQDLKHGDYTTNVAFSASKQLKKSPLEIGNLIVSKIQELKLKEEKNTKDDILNTKYLDKVEAVKPGFVNFTLSQEFLINQLRTLITEPEKIAKSTKMENEKVVVEFTDPNPFKEFHIGHLYTNTVGESLSRILESQGAVVWRADYFGDVGMHVAKAIYGILQISNIQYPISNKDEVDKILSELEKKPLQERIKILGQAYANGATAYEEDKQAAEDIKIINRLVYVAAQKMWQEEKGLTPAVDYAKGYTIDENKLQQVYKLYTTGRKWSLEYFDSIYDRLGMKFDGYYPESIAGEKGYQLVKNHMQDNVFEESDGAIVFSGKDYGLHTRVFINSLGLPTYEAKELGLAPWKYEDFKYTKSIIVTGSEITEYFKVLIAAMKAVKPELGNITVHLPHGMVRLPEGKMSSRTGKIVTGEWLIDTAVQKASEMSKHSLKIEGFEGISESFKTGEAAKNQAMKPSELINSAEQVGIGAIKYAFLKSGIGKDIEFDFETSLSLNGNSGPYLQYTYVRTQSILEKVKSQKSKVKSYSSSEEQSDESRSSSRFASLARTINLSDEELSLLRMLIHYPEVISGAAENLSPSTIATYLYEFAKAFNLFYQKKRIVDALTEAEKEFRIALTKAVGIILRNGLYLLGIQAPARM